MAQVNVGKKCKKCKTRGAIARGYCDTCYHQYWRRYASKEYKAKLSAVQKKIWSSYTPQEKQSRIGNTRANSIPLVVIAKKAWRIN